MKSRRFSSLRLSSLIALLVCSRPGFAFVPEEGLPQASNEKLMATHAEPVTELDFRSAILRVQDLAWGLETGCKAYRQNLDLALHKLGYGPYHPLFRTSLNGFDLDQIDLEAADEFKMGSFAFSLKSSGQTLTPDPFEQWVQVQRRLDTFEKTLDGARRVVTRAGIYAFNSKDNIPREVFVKLRKQWLAAVAHATEAYEHALAVRAVLDDDGEMVPAPESFRFIYDGGKYGVICLFGQCSDQSIGSINDASRVPPIH
jgi:hypothetical protein